MISDIEKTLFHEYFGVFLIDDIISNILYFEKTFLIFPFNLSYSWQSNNHLILKEQICIAKIFWKICKIISKCLQIIKHIWKLIITLSWHTAYHISNVPLINEINENYQQYLMIFIWIQVNFSRLILQC